MQVETVVLALLFMLAKWVMIGTFQPTVHDHQLNSLMILLKISSATFNTYMDPLVMERCRHILQPNNLGNGLIPTVLAEVRG